MSGRVEFQEFRESIGFVIGSIAKRCDITHLNLVRYSTSPQDGYDGRIAFPVCSSPDLVTLEDFLNLDLKKDEKIGQGLGVSSLVRLGSSLTAHMMQVDYDRKFPSGSFRDQLVGLSDCLCKIFTPEVVGDNSTVYIADSGSGLHMYGSKILTSDQWNMWIGSLRKEPHGVDIEWLNNLVTRRRYSVLRIKKNDKKTQNPIVFAKADISY